MVDIRFAVELALNWTAALIKLGIPPAIIVVDEMPFGKSPELAVPCFVTVAQVDELQHGDRADRFGDRPPVAVADRDFSGMIQRVAQPAFAQPSVAKRPLDQLARPLERLILRSSRKFPMLQQQTAKCPSSEHLAELAA